MTRHYHCAECGRRLEKSGQGLGTWTCPIHPERLVSVVRDLSGGKEDSRPRREVGMAMRRHTKVEVRHGA